MGMVHDRTGSYDMAMIVAMCAFIMAAVVAWMLPDFRDAPDVVPRAPAAAGPSSA